MTYKEKYKNCDDCPIRDICEDSLTNSEALCAEEKDPETLREEWDEYIEAYCEYIQQYGYV